MLINKITIRKTIEIGVMSFLLLLTGIAYGQSVQEIAQDEKTVTLTVENMT